MRIRHAPTTYNAHVYTLISVQNSRIGLGCGRYDGPDASSNTQAGTISYKSSAGYLFILHNNRILSLIL
jgi:hypothetical protein